MRRSLLASKGHGGGQSDEDEERLGIGPDNIG